MRLFELHRDIDESGVSGTGIVTQGVEFDDGQVCMLWLTALKGYPQVYPHLERVLEIHGHDGKTRVVFLEDEEEEHPLLDTSDVKFYGTIDPEARQKILDHFRNLDSDKEI